MPRSTSLVLPLTLALGCMSAARAHPTRQRVHCDSASEPDAPAELAVSPPENAELPPGRYWFLNAECRPLDVRVVRREGDAEFMEYALHSDGGVHSSKGAVFYLARDGALLSAGFRRAGLSLEHACNAERQPLSTSSTSFAGVQLYADLSSCEAQECTAETCLARFSFGDCGSSVATSARKLRRVTRADETSRQRTFLRFQRLGRRGRLWMDGDGGCVAVQARRDGTDLTLRYSELVEDRRGEFTVNYVVAPFDLRGYPVQSTTLFADGGAAQIAWGVPTSGVGLYFGDGEVLLGERDLFFERSACEAVHAATLARAAYFRGHSASMR